MRFVELMSADTAVANEIRADSQSDARTMVGLSHDLRKRDENIFRVLS